MHQNNKRPCKIRRSKQICPYDIEMSSSVSKQNLCSVQHASRMGSKRPHSQPTILANSVAVTIKRETEPNYEDMILGHFSFSPSSHRRYNRSAMGDLLFVGDSGRGTAGGSDVAGKPETSSCSSVTTRPLDVISLFLIIRLCGKSPRDV